MSQFGFSDSVVAVKHRLTLRERFLAEMVQVIFRLHRIALIEAGYQNGNDSRASCALKETLCIRYMQMQFAQNDHGMEECLSDRQSIGQFAGLPLGRGALLDEARNLNSGHTLERIAHAT